jgi:hypothetical protein
MSTIKKICNSRLSGSASKMEIDWWKFSLILPITEIVRWQTTNYLLAWVWFPLYTCFILWGVFRFFNIFLSLPINKKKKKNKPLTKRSPFAHLTTKLQRSVMQYDRKQYTKVAKNSYLSVLSTFYWQYWIQNYQRTL